MMIELHDLTKIFGDIKAVDKLTLDVPQGVTVGFLGPNGAGKTTTIKILTNLITATSGRALLQGIDVVTDPKHALKNVGAVVETPEFYPYLTPVETLSYLGRLRGMPADEIRTRTRDVLDQVKLTEWRSTRIGKFSKGMKQRLAIGQALLHEPDILILDEPTSGLDPRGMVEVREIILSLKRAHYTIFMSSHLLAEVSETCDLAAVIDRGKLLIYDPIEKIKSLVKIIKLEVTTVSSLPEEVLAKVRLLPRVREVERANSNVFVVTFEGSVDDRAGLLESLQGMGLKITGFSPVGLPLEMMYMELVKESR